MRQQTHSSNYFIVVFLIFNFMNSNKLVLILLVIVFFVVGCKKENQSTIMLTVFDTPSYSVQIGEKPEEIEITCFMVTKEEGSGVEQNLDLYSIEKFTYEKGFEYLLKVRKTQIGVDYQYSLIELVSKTQTGELEDIVLLNVTTERIEGELPNERVVVKEEEDYPLWYRYSFKFEGFEYEKGFEYMLRVRKTVIQLPPQSGFGYFHIYTLVEIISKTPNSIK